VNGSAVSMELSDSHVLVVPPAYPQLSWECFYVVRGPNSHSRCSYTIALLVSPLPCCMDTPSCGGRVFGCSFRVVLNTEGPCSAPPAVPHWLGPILPRPQLFLNDAGEFSHRLLCRSVFTQHQ
jgi:hypothetical protein